MLNTVEFLQYSCIHGFVTFSCAVTRMEELTKLLASERANKVHVTKLRQKIDDKAKDTITDIQIPLLRSFINQLFQKRQTLKEFNDKILVLLETPEDLEHEIIKAEDLDELILVKVYITEMFIELANKNVD